MKVYKTLKGIIVENTNRYYLIKDSWDQFINNHQVFYDTLKRIDSLQPLSGSEEIILQNLLPPVGSQEIWAAGVTYLRSRTARIDEAKDAGSGDFYDRVYTAERPELFFKSAPHRVAGPGQCVRIRKDSQWNVPEPELTLMISSSGKITGYTIGNDMSSRDIEGENPLYLPQAKTYDNSAALGPCIYIAESPLPPETQIVLKIIRSDKIVFSGEVSINQIKRKFTELAEFLYRETSFPSGCLLMTGTGIVPPNDFTLQKGDTISITIEPIGTLINTVS